MFNHLSGFTFANISIQLAPIIGLWCNGNTTGFGSVIGGSNPPSPTSFVENCVGNGYASALGCRYFLRGAIMYNLYNLL